MASLFTVENLPAGTIYYWGYFEQKWIEVSPSKAWDLMHEYMKGSTYSEFDRMVRYGLRGELIKLLNGGSQFQFVAK